MALLLRNIRVPVTCKNGRDLELVEAEALETARQKLKKAGVTARTLSLYKASLDARKKNEIGYICAVTAEPEAVPPSQLMQKIDAAWTEEAPLDILSASAASGLDRRLLEAPPVVVGFGPAGMFAALMLAEAGYRPIVLERGQSVRERQKSVSLFFEKGLLKSNSNIQFGAGGAGTFSDGKLMTRIGDSKCRYVLSRMVEFGAPKRILVQAKPHIGSDLLPGMVERIAKRIEAVGGKICYDTVLTGIAVSSDGRITKLQTADGELAAGAVILAIGHSARDTYEYLLSEHYKIEAKPFSVGVRIEHLQEKISEAMYGDMAKWLPPADYGLSYRKGDRGVYSFCMCPGGEVIAAASEEGGVVTNGMSCFARDGRNSNSALAVSVLPDDFGGTPAGAIAFQRTLERAAFRAGGKNYDAPLQTVGDFITHTSGNEPTEVCSTYRNGGHFALCDFHALLPSFVSSLLEEGIYRFGRQIVGFDAPQALLTGIETRTSAPLRILRNEFRTAPGHANLYPCGEGAGYAGGITSAAVDGVNCALALMNAYRI